ncbi:DUF6415 family natural product biosynthesis protein [Streptomyces sp. NPDC048507]|uniref:DUF6415 family natural product biosynthesis protein n=1 Tax=Streptomyces sp. NPDC048507 TaxID=3365560 RepID=UPI00371D47E1
MTVGSTAMEPGETQAIDDLIGRAIVPYSDRPDAKTVAHLIDDLITHGQILHARVAALPQEQRTERAGAALVEWDYFAAAGPIGSGDHANWNHARALARILRNLRTAVDQASRTP